MKDVESILSLLEKEDGKANDNKDTCDKKQKEVHSCLEFHAPANRVQVYLPYVQYPFVIWNSRGYGPDQRVRLVIRVYVAKIRSTSIGLPSACTLYILYFHLRVWRKAPSWTFGLKKREAVRRYPELIEDGFNMGRREDLTGGGLRRSAGGWESVFWVWEWRCICCRLRRLPLKEVKPWERWKGNRHTQGKS